ncbi:MAG: response regulator [Bacteroidaceae bacterium]|nr:response regulator [Bacteroidaceae bacterium]
MNFNPSEYKILIVDDVSTNILLLKVMLSNEKFNVVTANSGLAAIESVKTEHPDLILLDVMMPGMNGFEVARVLKSEEATKDIPIIFITALNSPEDIVKGFKIGANDFVSKPFNKDELLIRVKHQLSLIAAKRTILQKTEELELTIEARDKLYSVIAHDLRSPMSSIKMVLNMLLLSIKPETIGQEEFEMLSDCNQTIEDVFGLLDNLLRWTKTQVGRLHVAFQNFDVIALTEGVKQVSTMVAKAKNIQLVLDKSDDLTTLNVCADADMVQTVLRNFISNAIKFSEEGSSIIIRIKSEGEKAVLSVQDAGCGIPEEGQAKLLHTNTHFSTFGTKKEQGSGLGLLLCKDFVEKNNGEMWFESTVGVGSTFYFSLALADDRSSLTK